MNDSIKSDREKLYASYNFAGTSDWAVDLLEFHEDGIGDGNDDDYEVDVDLYDECGATYKSLSALKDKKNSIPSHYIYIYIAKVLSKMMDDALKKYDDMIEDGYDNKFKTFAGYVTGQVPYQINAFMGNGKAGNYFKCEETGLRNCYGSCRYFYSDDDIENCDDSDDCKDRKGTFEIKCPTQFKNGEVTDWTSPNSEKPPNTTFTLEKKDDFYKAIFDDYGIEKDWISFGDTRVHVSNGCQYAGKDIKECAKREHYWYWNYPEASDDIEVSDPKDIIGDSYDESKDLASRLRILIMMAPYDEVEDPADLVDAAMLPALSIESAVNSMEDVAEKAKEIKESEKQETILFFITSVLFFIPFVGSAAGSVGLASVRAILGMLGTVTEAGLLTYSVVENPDNAFATIFSTLATAGLGRSGWGKAASSRREISSKDMDALGFKKQTDRFESLKVTSCKI